MTRGRVWAGVLLLVLMMGCARDTELQGMQAAMDAFEGQNHTSHQKVEAEVQQLSDRLTEVERAQAETRQAEAETAATVDTLRLQLRRLQQAVQKIQQQVQRSAREGTRDTAARIAHIERRLRAVATQLNLPSS